MTTILTPGALLANGIQTLFSDYGINAAFIGCDVLTLILTETVTNNAAAALAFLIAWSTAQAFGDGRGVWCQRLLSYSV